jgi:hypothetical protein
MTARSTFSRVCSSASSQSALRICAETSAAFHSLPLASNRQSASPM